MIARSSKFSIVIIVFISGKKKGILVLGEVFPKPKYQNSDPNCMFEPSETETAKLAKLKCNVGSLGTVLVSWVLLATVNDVDS